MSKMNLIIIGAGQYGSVVEEIAKALGYDKIDFLDDNNGTAMAKTSGFEQYINEYKYAICAIGKSEIRLEWITKLRKAGYEVPSLTHPQAYVSESAKICMGTIVEPMAVVHANTTISVGCIISANATVNHNSVCHEGCHIDCGAVVASSTTVPKGTKVENGVVYTASKTPDVINGRVYSFDDVM